LKALPYNTISNAYADSKNGYSMYIPFEGNQYYPGGSGEESWNAFYTVSFIKLQAGVRPEQLAAPVRKLLALNSPETISKNLNVVLKPLDSFYLTTDNGTVSKTLSILSLVALGILLLAIINFVNIMIGTSSYRMREIGLRKVFGGRRRELILQYLVESVVLTLFAAVLSVFFYGMFRPLFNEVLNTSLQPVSGFTLREMAWLGIIVLAVGCIAGLYPAVILSGSEMVNSVKGKSQGTEKDMWMRKTLLVLQFAIAIGVFIFSMILSKQVEYFFNQDLGYNKERLMIVTAFPKKWDSAGVLKMESIRNSLLNSSAIEDASVSFDIPEKTPPGQLTVNPQGPKNSQPISLQTVSVDEKFASTYGIHIKEGKFFSNQTGVFVPGEAVINETAMKAFGWNTAQGKKLDIPNGGGSVTVVGVVKDFHLTSMHESIEPLVFFR
jgi:putative ABC transport system permease protein